MLNKIKENKLTLIVMAICFLLFLLCALWVRPAKEEQSEASDYAEYENGVVTAILSDNTYQDDFSDGGWRGEQMLTVLVKSGRYKGETLLAYNYVGPIYSVPVKVNDGVTLIISTYSDGSHQASVYELNRIPGIVIMIVLFALATVLIGGKNGAKSLIGLVFIALCLFLILLPGLMKGAPPVLMTFIVCTFIAAFSLMIMSGFNTKTVCAFLGTIAGVAMGLLFAWIFQKILRIDGLREENVEGLLQLNQMGYKIGLRGLLSAGIIISSLGAVMDVTMGLASSISELHDTDPGLTFRQLFLSGMNIGKDMVSTMTATLIMAFLGSSFVLILYLYSLSLSKYQLLSSAYLSLELISSLSSSFGAIMAVPITTFISAKAFSRK
ncbi:MAG: YibE/F family protein [Erysipelotrichaceae bacterium]|nr:YibE/F family protein [Erysipelotrichaceae bacterium]